MMTVYIIKVFTYNDNDGDGSEYGRSWQQIGAYASLDSALKKAKSYLESELAFYEKREYEAIGTADEITTALKVSRYPVEYINSKDGDITKEIEIERLKVED